MSKKPRKIASSLGVNSLVAARAKQRRDTQRSLRDIALRTPAARDDLAPELKLETRPLAEILPAARRIRKADPAQVARVKASISRFGVCAPVLVDADGRIVDGHAACDAAHELGMTSLPCVVVSHLSSEEVRLLSITLNRLAERGVWDPQALRLEFAELVDLGEDVLVTGFEMAEVDMVLLPDDEESQETEPEDPLALGATAVSRPADVWLLGHQRLTQGDSRDPAVYARLMEPDEKAQLLLTDVPYNVPNVGHVTTNAAHREFAMAGGEMTQEEFRDFNRSWMEAALPFINDGGLLATTIDWRSIDVVLSAAKALDLALLNIVVWVKSNAGQGSLWRSQHELLPVWKVGQAPHVNNIQLGRHGRWRSNVWNYPGASSVGSDAREGLAVHPTVKPRVMLEDALFDVTSHGDIIIDCFSGSGSTLLAAETTGRRCRAIEIDGLYCDVAIRRWQDLTGDEARLEETGETFEEATARRLASPSGQSAADVGCFADKGV